MQTVTLPLPVHERIATIISRENARRIMARELADIDVIIDDLLTFWNSPEGKTDTYA